MTSPAKDVGMSGTGWLEFSTEKVTWDGSGRVSFSVAFTSHVQVIKKHLERVRPSVGR